MSWSLPERRTGTLARFRNMIRSAVNKVGVDVVRYDANRDPRQRLARRLKQLDTDLVIDVGANAGQYARSLRNAGYRGRLVSFEPLSGPFASLSAAAEHDDQWTTIRAAVGAEEGSLAMN